MNLKEQNLNTHFQELKLRVIISFAVFCLASMISYCFAGKIYQFLMEPLSRATLDTQTRNFIFTNLTEVFFTYIKLAIFSGFIVSFPIIISQIYLFVAPALYKNEKKIFIPFLIISPLLFIIGALFVYYLIFPIAWKFFLSFENSGSADMMPIILQAKVSEYLSLVISLIIAFGLAFQVPVVIVLLGLFGIVNSKWLKEKRKISIVLIFILAAFLTPPDVVSQIMLAVPMLILYELSIYACKYLEKKRKIKMHDVKLIRNNVELFDEAMKKRGIPSIAAKIIDIDEERRQLVTLIQKLQQARNEKAKVISKYAGKDNADVRGLKKDAADIKEKLTELEDKLNSNTELEILLSTLPNIPDDSVPVGSDETFNQEVRRVGEVGKFNFTPKQHFEIGEGLGMMDFVDSAKMSGSRFVTLKSALSRLERALANFMLDIHTSRFNFQEISPPYLVKDEAMFGTGQLPNLEEDSFKTTNGYRLIPTSEVSLANLVAGKILKNTELPMRFTAYTPCFRSEAGSAGRDTRGMIRLHQFTKVELVSITTAEESDKEHEYITSAAEEILKLLKLPYRVMLLSSGDMGFCARKTYDLEVWLPGQNNYREISSCSNCGEFQGRRMKARYRAEGEKETTFVHTLNGSALAVGRTIVAILENYQNEDGSVTVPEVLRPYMNGMEVIKA